MEDMGKELSKRLVENKWEKKYKEIIEKTSRPIWMLKVSGMENGRSNRRAAIIHNAKKVVLGKRWIANARITTMSKISTPPATLI